MSNDSEHRDSQSQEIAQTNRETVDVEAEAQSLLKVFNDAAADTASELEWFAMGLNRETMERAFVFEAKGYIDPDGLTALRDAGRVVEYIEGYQKPPEDDVYCQIQIPKEGEVAKI